MELTSVFTILKENISRGKEKQKKYMTEAMFCRMGTQRVCHIFLKMKSKKSLKEWYMRTLEEKSA